MLEAQDWTSDFSKARRFTHCQAIVKMRETPWIPNDAVIISNYGTPQARECKVLL
jgi:hypothetical protein